MALYDMYYDTHYILELFLLLEEQAKRKGNLELESNFTTGIQWELQ